MAPEPLERSRYDAAVAGSATLRSESLRDTDDYWRPRARMVAAALGVGVVSGLELAGAVGAAVVAVSPGVALDGAGELISVAPGGRARLDGPDGTVVDVSEQGVELALPGSGTWAVTIAFRESPEGGGGAVRVRHVPVLAMVAEDVAAGDPALVTLGRVVADAAGTVATVAAGARAARRLAAGEVGLVAGASDAGTVDTTPVGQVRVLDDGSGLGLRVGAGPDQLSVRAAVIETGTPVHAGGDLTVAGALRAAGTLGGAGVDVAGRPALGGDSWLRLNPTGRFEGTTAGTWLHADRLAVGAHTDPGVGNLTVAGGATISGLTRIDGSGVSGIGAVALEVGARVRFSQGVTASAGAWFSQRAAPDAAFVGMADDGRVGFYGVPLHNWGLLMDTATGAVDTVALTVRGALTALGPVDAEDLTVDGTLTASQEIAADGGVRLPRTGGGVASLGAGGPGRPTGTLQLDMGLFAGPYRFEIGNSVLLDPSWAFRTVFSIDQDGHATFAGGKGGYVADHAVNRADRPLEPGDVVVVGAGAPPASYGTDDAIPIFEVELATGAADTRVCGVVAGAVGLGSLPPVALPADLSGRAAPEHPLAHLAADGGDAVGVGRMGRVVTLGAFAHCKVDADGAPVAAGDLLVTSETPGHARRAPDEGTARGAVLGKALAPLGSGRGVIPVLVTVH